MSEFSNKEAVDTSENAKVTALMSSPAAQAVVSAATIVIAAANAPIVAFAAISVAAYKATLSSLEHLREVMKNY